MPFWDPEMLMETRLIRKSIQWFVRFMIIYGLILILEIGLILWGVIKALRWLELL